VDITSDLTEKIQSAITEIGHLGNCGMLQIAINKFHKNGDGLVATDLYLSRAVAVNIAHPFWKLCLLQGVRNGVIEEYFLNIYDTEHKPMKVLGAKQSALGIVVIDENLLVDEDMLACIRRNSSQYAVMMLLNYATGEFNNIGLKFDSNGKFFTINADEVTVSSLKELLAIYINDSIREKLNQRSVLNTMQPLIMLTKEAVQRENQHMAIRKNLNNQLSSVLRKDEAQVNISDFVNTIKTQIQNWNAEVERSLKLKYEDLNRPATGLYSQNLFKWSEQLTDLEQEDIAEKSEKLGASINKEFSDEFIGKVRKELESDFSNDYNIILNSAESLVGKINYQLIQRGIISESEKSIFDVDFKKFPNPEKTLKNYVIFTRAYSGELIKKGVTEYFIALREYTGIIMVAVGLLAPLNMISSAASSESSSHHDSFFSKIAQPLKEMSTGIRFFTAFMTLGMIFYGYFDLRKRIPRRRKEEFERELRKAKEMLNTEGKRMFMDGARDWQNIVNQWQKEVYTQLNSSLEKAIKEFSTSGQQRLSEEKNRIQRLVQGIDNNVKRIANAEKLADGALRSYKDALSDLDRAFKN
jgi:hypothetical protein